MSFVPYLSFNGQAREALTAYAQIFGATDLQLMAFSDAPPETAPPETAPPGTAPAGAAPAGAEKLIMHGQFSAGGSTLMAADMPGNPPDGMASPSVFHGAANAETAARVFAALSERGQIILPLGQTFWSPCFGMLKDRFGTTWMITLAA
ncbi:MAG: PhnB protein [Rhodobacteraceae bacterium]|uniref:VOC family protein n=1 Tax=Cypionkella sp. TaxID=2811411 RepID=UPI00132BBE51|nr:VOC family protein [Cypionkella sp.]KAF0173119.1 MAG: PhnB protein [Paracoccaceae bacterium]MDO8327608.1 VOC family protein [Cypionkella sp.]